MDKKIFLLVTKKDKINSPIFSEIVKFLQSIGGEIYCIPEKEEYFKNSNISGLPSNYKKEDIYLAITMGGDGTTLKAAKFLYGSNVPILGINLGTLGYLADVDPADAIDAIKLFINGSSTIEKRYCLSVKYNDYVDIAINEAVIFRGNASHIIRAKVKINGQDTMNIRVDGIIVSTPTGSTAYNLSAGGPIITPLSRTLVLTPICAHSLSARPIVVADDSLIEIYVDRKDNQEYVSLDVDGKNICKLTDDLPITVKIAEKQVLLVRTKQYNFYERLQNKLMLINQ